MKTVNELQRAAPEPTPQQRGRKSDDRARHPAVAYLASLTTPSGRRSMLSGLNTAARILGAADARTAQWERLRFSHVTALRSVLAERYRPATANRILSAVRGVLKAAWRLGLIGTDDYQRAGDVANVRGSTLPAGRALDAGELLALFTACRRPGAAAARDAALFALLAGCGLRRQEAAGIDVADLDLATKTLRVRGKGRRERLTHLNSGTAAAIRWWLRHRGDTPGPLLRRVTKDQRVLPDRLTAEAMLLRVKKRAAEAGIQPCSPHDLRRTFVTNLLDADADVATVARMAGHANVQTTTRYDRRGEEQARRAAENTLIPFREPTDDGRSSRFSDPVPQHSTTQRPHPARTTQPTPPPARAMHPGTKRPPDNASPPTTVREQQAAHLNPGATTTRPPVTEPDGDQAGETDDAEG